MDDDEDEDDDEEESDDDNSYPQNFWRLVKKLYENGFYKRLHFYISNVDEVASNLIGALHALESLCIIYFYKSFNLNKLTNLKEISILNGAKPTEMEILANSLFKLERVFLKDATYDDMLPFICKSSKLKEFKIYPKSEDKFNGGIIDLFELNKIRAPLSDAVKTTIFVPINVFLKTKWATKNGNVNFEFIELKKSDSHDRDLRFHYTFQSSFFNQIFLNIVICHNNNNLCKLKKINFLVF